MTDPAKVTFADARRVGFCAKGQRLWFEARGLNYLDFVRNGIDVEKIRALHDGYADLLIRRAEARHGR